MVADLSWLANLPGQSVGGATNSSLLNPNASGNQGQTDAGYNSASPTDPDFLAHLNQLKQYDPNASITTSTNSDGQPMYGLSYDQNKMPAVPTGGDNQRLASHTDDFAANFQKQLDTGLGSDAIYHSVIDPSKNINDPIYGHLTPGSNVTTTMVPTKDNSMLGTIGPMLPALALGGASLLASEGIGAGAAGYMGGAADAGGSTAFGNALIKGSMGVPQALNDNNPLGVAGAAAGAAGVGLGWPSWIMQLAKTSPALFQLLTSKKGP